jgi:hypothetical protein
MQLNAQTSNQPSKKKNQVIHLLHNSSSHSLPAPQPWPSPTRPSSPSPCWLSLSLSWPSPRVRCLSESVCLLCDHQTALDRAIHMMIEVRACLWVAHFTTPTPPPPHAAFTSVVLPSARECRTACLLVPVPVHCRYRAVTVTHHDGVCDCVFSFLPFLWALQLT